MKLQLLFLVCCGAVLNGIAQEAPVIDIRIDVSKTYQTIDNFGASDAWSCQFIGNWPDRARNAIADWLFSLDTLSNGSPKGIGLSVWRMNLGAGSTRQGDSSGIRDEWRRAESFLDQNNHWNPQRCQGQQWFLQAAKQRGVRQFLGFFNSPPVPFTINGKAYATKGQCNINNNRYNDFAAYGVHALQQLQQTAGIDFNYISPVNEPQWDWSDGGQEGCPYANTDIGNLVKAFNTALLKSKLTTKIIVPEAGQLTYLLEDGDKPGKGNQVNDFFNPSSANYIGNLPTVKKVIASHSYFTTSPFSQAIDLRKKIADRVTATNGLAYWQSEYCILGDNEGEINGRGRDLGMTSALYLARCIYADLVAGNATAWQWWTAISAYNYKDGLIYVDKNKTGGNYYDSKMLWALGNYSRFVRPGMKRIDVKMAASTSLLASAYIDQRTKKLIVVVINNSDKQQQFFLDDGLIHHHDGITWYTYTTSASASLEKKEESNNRFVISPNSIETIETKY